MPIAPERQPAYLIVNADDYGYFDCVSRGILETATGGILTATGVFATSSKLGEHAAWLMRVDSLDVGVHLNLTGQAPLTTSMEKSLSRWDGRFPNKFTIARAVLSGAIAAADVKLEWRAQIERCLEYGLHIRFLNSHEHIHMLPTLFTVVQDLAAEFGIQHIRFPTSELVRGTSVGSLVRDALIKITGMYNHRFRRLPCARFLGMGISGRLNMEYLKQLLPGLRPGSIYELMCHPGICDRNEITDARLLRYHDWNGERETLTKPEVQDMLEYYGIRLIGYRNLKLQGDRLIASPDSE